MLHQCITARKRKGMGVGGGGELFNVFVIFVEATATMASLELNSTIKTQEFNTILIPRETRRVHGTPWFSSMFFLFHFFL